MTDDDTDELLQNWGRDLRETRAAADSPAEVHELTEPRPVTRPHPRRRVYTGLAAAAAVVAVALGVGLTRGSTPATHRTPSVSSSSTSASGTQQISSGGLAVTVPASWPVGDADCGIPQSNTVLLDTSHLDCLPYSQPRVTWVQFGSSSYRPGLVDTHSEPISVHGHAATRTNGRPEESYWRKEYAVDVVVPDLGVRATIYSPDNDTAGRIAATLTVVDHDANGCASQTKYVALPDVPASTVAGAQDDLVPGSPTALVACTYAAGHLVIGKQQPASALGADLDVLRGLQTGYSMEQGKSLGCSGPDDSPHSVDSDANEYVLLLRYADGSQLRLVARVSGCGYLGVTNGSVSGRATVAFARWLLPLTAVSGGFPPWYIPAP